MKKKSITENVNLIFDLKDRFVEGVSELEKEIFEQSEKIVQLEEILAKMKKIAKNSESVYFQKRLDNSLKIIKNFRAKREYGKKEFDLIFHSVSKIKKTDSIELLNESLKNRIERISEHFVQNEVIQRGKKVSSGEKYFTFRYRSVNFIIDNSPKKIIKNVERKKTRCKIEGKFYPIFPSLGFGISDEDRIFDEFCDLIILKTNLGYRCFHSDELGLLVQFSKDTFQRMLRPTERRLKSITHYIKWKNERYYYIPEKIE
ncbi:MAG: hypothetical protein L6Q54_11110 [Leptospiraceae bacterium]|nr:hypothetical protein [Leptospiraceae bacterium]MCK6381777.1 hypothetical protein [Leptospiraceae bacterium]NUM40619.1 hypothetical protein [Leptospiraceae bacterium]